MSKLELREFYINKRNNLTLEEFERINNNIFKNLINMDIYIKSTSILTYVSVGREIDTKSIINHALQQGKTVAVPKVISKTEMQFYKIKSLNDLYTSKMGLLEPRTDGINRITSFISTLCIVPALCLDKSGNRVGYGGGYYDRFLSQNRITAVALASIKTILKQVPVSNYDQPVDLIVTD